MILSLVHFKIFTILCIAQFLQPHQKIMLKSSTRMLDPDLSKYAALLRQQYIFQGLNDAQLAHVVTRFERVDKPKDAIVYTQGSQGDGFYVIYQGSVRVSKTDDSHERQLRILGPGEYFGEGALLFVRPRSDSVTAIEPTVLLRLDRESFADILELLPEIRMNLSATAESRYLAQKEKFEWLSDDEVIYLISRKHEFFLAISLIAPVIIGVVALPVLVMSFSSESPFFSTAGLILGFLGLIGSILLGIWNWIDWGNDFYIVTNQRVVWLERVIMFYYSRQEAPLTQVLAVNVRSSYLGRLMNYGDVDVRTFTGGIPMRKMNNPKRFASFVEGYQTRAKRRQKIDEAGVIDKELKKRLEMKKEPPVYIPPISKKEELKPKKEKSDTLRDILDTFLKMRFERDGVITYRKHWLVLIGKTFFPTLAFLILLVLTGAWIYQELAKEGIGLSQLTVALILGVLYACAFLWWVYHYLDWNNDIYQLTADQIVDIERKPLGEEQKKSAPLDSILSIEHAREGIIELIFNFGDVVINVGQTKFIFRGVYNPDRVHQDVADFIEARRRKKIEAEAERERQKMLDWFGSYQKHKDKLDESQKTSDWDLFPG